MKLLVIAGAVFALLLTAIATPVVLAVLMAPGEVFKNLPEESPKGPQLVGFVIGTVPLPYRDLVAQAGTVCPEISSPLIAAQIQAESAWNPTASSGVASGIAQFTDATWKTYGKDANNNGTSSPLDPGDAIPAQARYMCDLAQDAKAALAKGQVEGDVVSLALAGYNAGWQNVLDAKGLPSFPETKAYVEKIQAALADFQAGAYKPGTGTSAIQLVITVGRVPPGRTKPSDGSQTKGLPAADLEKARNAATHANGQLPPELLCPVNDGWLLRCDAAWRFRQLNAAYKAQFGTDIPINDSYRDYGRQVRAKQLYGKMAATPGTSNHGWGLALDLGVPTSTRGSAQNAWFIANAPRYGWWWPTWMRVGDRDFQLDESWHFEFAEGMVIS